MWKIGTLVILGLAGACQPAEETAMALDVKLTIEKTEFLFQESPRCLLTLTNSGKETIQISNPVTSLTMPVFKLTDGRTGEETVFQKKPSEWEEDIREPLPPGKSLERGFFLLDEIKIVAPGAYRLSVLYEYDAGKKAESAPLKLNVLPATPKNLSLIGNGPWGSIAVQYGAWVNLAADPPQIMRTLFEALPGGGVRSSHAIAKAELEAKPVLSAPPNRSTAKSHWVGWLDENYLRFAHFDENMGPSPVGKFELPKLELEIISSLHSDPVTDTRVRPNAAALIWMGDPDGTRSGLQVVELSPNKATAGGTVNLPGARPGWIASFERSNGTPLALLAQSSGDKVVLSSLPWPDKERGGTLPAKLFEWRGKFAAAGATIDAADAILGAVLIWTGKGETLELVSWSWDAKGSFAEGEKQKIEWEYGKKLDSAFVRVNSKGAPVAALRDGDGNWSGFTGEEKPVPLPGPYAQTKLPFDIAFLGGTEPVLIGGRNQMGFEMIKLDGSPLPTKRR